MACLGKTEVTDLEANPEEMESEAEYREVPKEHAAVETGKAPNKRHRGWHLVAKRRQKPKERTRGNYGSRKKLADDPPCKSGAAQEKRRQEKLD
jgi:hypothetical protein